MKVLLIFEVIPDETYACIIEDPTTEELKVLLDAAGVFGGVAVNQDEEPVEKINEWISDKWKDCKVSIEKPIRGPIDHAIICGWVV